MQEKISSFFEKFSFYKSVFLLVFSWLIIVNVFGLLALNRLNLNGDNAYKWIPTDRYYQGQTWNFLKLHDRWDSNWYFDIVKNGYKRDAQNDTLSNIVFFPLYPYLIKGVSFVLGTEGFASGWIISTFFLFLSSLYLFKLVKKFHKEADSLLVIFLLLIFPSAFFLNAVYTESLFLFLSIVSFYYAMNRNYGLAIAFGFFASITRITGIFLFFPLLFEFFSREGLRKETLISSLKFLCVPLGTFLFLFYHWIRFGDFLLFFKVESAWGRSFELNRDHFLFTTGAEISNFFLDTFFLLFSLFIMIVLFKKKNFSYVIYMASTVFAAVGSGTLMSIGRYILVLFPIYIVGASLRSELLRYVWIIVSILLFSFYITLFVNWYWAG